MGNMALYEKYRAVPPEAQKKIGGGRLKGMTDINPMWRIKCLTEEFGPCGIGWKPVIVRQWLEPSESGQCAAFCNIDLYVKVGDVWSDAIPGTGGAMYIAKENSGLYVDDEAFKKAYTDAISVACKALGFGADIYWDKDSTEYTQRTESQRMAQGDNEARAERGKRLVEIRRLCPDEAKLNKACARTFGKNIAQLTIDELDEILAKLAVKDNAADS